MTTAQFIAKLNGLDIRLSVKGGKLSVNAPDGAITPELRTEIGARKEELLSFIGAESDFVLTAAPNPEEGPLSFAQQRLWFLYRLNSTDVSYNLGASAIVPSDLSDENLASRISTVVHNNHSLRTTFPERDGIPFQRVIALEPTLNILNLDVTAEESDRLYGIQQDIMRKPFHLETEAPVRFDLLKLSDGTRILLISIHHIVSDAWSLGILIDRLIEGSTTSSDFQYLDFAHSEQEWFNSHDQQRHREYWKEIIKGPIPSLELPTKPLSLSSAGVIGDSYSFRLSPEVSESLKVQARNNNVTLYSVLLALFKVVLYRYSGQQDILVGTPVSSRNSVELEDIIGIFINTLVVRTKFYGESSFISVAKQIHNSMLDALDHRDYPFEKIVELARQEKLSHNAALFRTGFILNNTPGGGKHQDFTGGSIFDISLYMEDSKAGILGTLEYNTNLFDRDTIERFAGHYTTLAESAAKRFETSVDSLQLLSNSEIVQLNSWNNTAKDYPKDLTTSQLFELQALESSNRIAVIAKSGQLTYSELNQKANQLARHLIKAGVSRGSLVGVCLDRDTDMLVSVLAIWKAGAAYVPLDPTYPEDRLIYMAEDAHLSAVVSESKFHRLAHTIAAAPKASIVLLDNEISDIRSNSHDNLVEKADNTGSDSASTDQKGKLDDIGSSEHDTIKYSARDVAYVIYTSGSTGRPKGVLIEHRSLVNLLCSIKDQLEFTSEDIIFSVTTLSFDIAGLELYLPLITGARVVISSRQTLADPRALAHKIKESGTTVVQATPAMWRFLLDSGWKNGSGLKILCGGEALSRQLANEILETGAELWNVYGPTETTIWSTSVQVERSQTPVSIGRPLANTQIYVLDESNNRVPLNIPGELYIAGDGVSRGYLNRPELTSERFIENTFAASQTGKMYRTGDQVRLNPEGQIEYIGRLDNQVKVRGYRIELGEIEAVLLKHPDVQQAVVIAREDTPGDQRLVAYLISDRADHQKSNNSKAGHSNKNGENETNADFDSKKHSELREFLSKSLPPFMIPAIFVQVNSFPLTPNGKVDRKALPAPASGNVVRGGKSHEAPESELEHKLIRIWEKVLGVSNIGRNDNFFDLGGNSLLGIRLLSGIERALNIRVPVAVIFQGQTVAAMAATLEDKDTLDLNLRAVAVQPYGKLPPLFFIPGVNGNVIGYEELAAGLGNERPLYGLRSVGLEGEADPLNELPAIAQQFVADVRKVQPEGPYNFMGFCIGGIVAFEMAQQLKNEGEKVEFLGLIDTWPQDMIPAPKAVSQTGQQLAYLTEALKRNIRELAAVPTRKKLQYIKQKLGAATDMATKLDVYRGDDGERLQDLVITSNQVAASTYIASKYDGPLNLYITLGDLLEPDPSDPRLYWKSFGNETSSVMWIPGIDSGSLLKNPYLPGLLKALKTTLEERNRI